MKRKWPLFIKILISMILGLLVGILLQSLGYSNIIVNWIKPFGEIFLRLLKMVAVPLVLVSLIKGIGNLGDISKLSSMGLRVIGIYICTTIIAIIFGVSMAYFTSPGKIADKDISLSLNSQYQSAIIEKVDTVSQISKQTPLQPLIDIFPENVFASMSSNGNMLQIIIFAMIIGVSIILIGESKSGVFMRFLDSLDAIVLKTIDIVMNFAVVGVFALMAGLIADSAGNLSVISALGLYVLVVIVSLLVLMYGLYPLLIALFTKQKPSVFIKAMFPVQLVAFSTSSSAATLPINMKTVEDRLNVPRSVASFVLPVGATINMDGTSCYQAIGVIFIAQVMGIDLSFAQILTIILTTTISSIGTPGIPGGSIVISMMVLTSVGIPAEGLALILGVDRPLDMLRTCVNVTGDAAVATIVSEKVK